MNIAHTIVLLLAVSIVSTAAAGEAPPAEVPMPENLDVEQLPPPIQWQQLDRDPLLERRLEFSFDLDLLAPLGTGAGNSAVWLAQLTSGDPEQLETEYLAEEVAPWADQARCSFYPEVYTFEGPATALPDSGALVEIASAWAAEARQDPARAGELGRRTLRLGRLLLMDELSAVQHQTGLALIAAGAAILDDHGRRAGDGALTTLTQRAIGDAANQRRLIADWAKAVGPARTIARTRDSLFAHPLFGPDIELSVGQFRRLLRLVTSDAHPALRHEASIDLALVMSGGSGAQRKQARETFLMIAANPRDPLSEAARWWADHPIDIDEDFMPIAAIE